jgi:anthranilate phosphoribosyltransferase
MSHAFRELLRKIGSGPHTGHNLTRIEAHAATKMMLLQEATPAQIGAFMIAHRIRRPTGEELTGMLDAYEELGPTLRAIAASRPTFVFGMPYDGRTRTMPIVLLTALIMAAAGCPVVLHGGDRMPTKEGDPLILFWHGLGMDWTTLPLPQVQATFEQTGIGFVYLPTHFPLAQGLVPYREQIGKRPPFATLELIWCPYAGDAHVVSGFVHPPTETIFQAAFALRRVSRFTTVKGLEGSPDLPRERTAIIGLGTVNSAGEVALERLCLSPREFGFEGANVPLPSPETAIAAMRSVLAGQPSELMKSALWNSGFYLWRCGISPSIQAGITRAEALLTTGQAKQKLQELQQATAAIALIR